MLMTRKDSRLTIGFTYNEKKPGLEQLDRYLEWDSHETIEGISRALESTGNIVVPLEADKDIYRKLEQQRDRLDIVFNIAECLSQEIAESEDREAAVPMFLDFLQIPYTGSSPGSLINALDKATAKEILSYYGIRTPMFERISHYTDRLRRNIPYPLMVKPVSEGTSIGISQSSCVTDSDALERTVRRIIDDYDQPALVEEFIDGLEYTVGIVGDLVFPILQINLKRLPGTPLVRDHHVKDIEPQYTDTSGKTDSALMLAPFDKRYRNLATQAVLAHAAIGCRDYNRMEFREKEGRTYFLEMNALPGMHPTEGDLPVMAKAAGIEYDALVNMILHEAISRYKANQKYSARFDDSRTEDIDEMVKSAKASLGFYKENATSREHEYVMVRPSAR